MKKTSLALLLATLSAASIAQTGAADVKLKRLRDLESCLQAYAPERCLESLEAYVARKPGEAYQAGKAARLNFRPWAGLRFFEKALQGKQASQVCADQDFALSMLSALELPTDYPDQQRAVKLLEGRCGSTVLPFLEKELQPSPSTYLVKSLRPTLLKQGRKVVACQPEAQAPASNRRIRPVGDTTAMVRHLHQPKKYEIPSLATIQAMSGSLSSLADSGEER